MNELTSMLTLQSKMHKKHGANALSQLFDSAIERIDEVEEYNLGLANESCQQQKKIAELEKALATSFEFLSMSSTAEYLFYESHKHLVKDQG